MLTVSIMPIVTPNNRSTRSRIKSSDSSMVTMPKPAPEIRRSWNASAVQKLLQIRLKNGGQQRGDINEVVKMYNVPHVVNRDSINYQLRLLKTKNTCTGNNENPAIATNETPDPRCLTVNNGFNMNVPAPASLPKANIVEENMRKATIALATTNAAKRYFYEKQKTATRMKDGSLAAIIAEEEEKAGLESGTVNASTVKSRLADEQKLDGIHKGKLSPFHEIEKTLVELCIESARMGQPLTQKDLRVLAGKLLHDTCTSGYESYKKKFTNVTTHNREVLVPGRKWYRLFMKRHGELLKVNAGKVDALAKEVTEKPSATMYHTTEHMEE